jgi:hypothetical protein
VIWALMIVLGGIRDTIDRRRLKLPR